MLQAVLTEQDAWVTLACQQGFGPHLVEGVARRRLTRGRPLVSSRDIMKWGPSLASLAGMLGVALAGYRETATLAEQLRLAFLHQRLEAGRLASAALANKGSVLAAWAEANDMPEQQLAFVAAALAGPPARLMGEKWLDAMAVLPPSLCPVCGHEPLLARLDSQDGGRRLLCSLCSSQYRVTRLGCVFCGNSEPSTLGYVVSEQGPPGWRIDHCEQCGRYIKTLDERKVDGVASQPFTLSDASTLELDALAQHLGYVVRGDAGAKNAQTGQS
jgi:FdhE protein